MESIITYLFKKVIDLTYDITVGDAKKEIYAENELLEKNQKRRIAMILISITIFLALGLSATIYVINQPSKKKESEVSNQVNNTYNTEINFRYLEDVRNEYFSLSRMDNNDELIAGQLGDYYYVDFYIEIDSSQEKELFFFEKGKYYTSDISRLKKSAKSFEVQIINNDTIKNLPFKIYIRGKADSLVYIRPQKQVRSYFYNNIPYFKKVFDNTYDSNKQLSWEISPSGFRNKDLPFLRGKFMFDFIAQMGFLPASRIKMLEGEVSERVSYYDRNVEIILYIPK